MTPIQSQNHQAWLGLAKMLSAMGLSIALMLTMLDHGGEALAHVGLPLAAIAVGIALLTYAAKGQRVWLILFGITLILLAGWAHTFSEMWVRWYPHWQYADKTLLKRLTGGSSYYSHGPLVPLTSLFVAGFIYKRVGFPVSSSKTSKAIGLMMIVFFLFCQIVSAYAGIMFASGFALVGLIGGLIVYAGGKNMATAYWMPVTLLLFMVPWPEEWISGLNFKLKGFATANSVWLTRKMGISLFQDGSILYFNPDAITGEDKRLVVEDVCSGLRSLISLIWFGALFSVVCRSKGFWRIVILLMSMPVAIGCNIVRITILNITADKLGVEQATEGGAIHDWSGFIVFALALGALFLIESIILKIGKMLKKDWCDDRLLGYLHAISKSSLKAKGRTMPWIYSGLIFVSVFAVLASQFDSGMYQGTYSRDAVPEQMTLSGVRYQRVLSEVDQQSKDILETNDCTFHTYYPDVTAGPSATPISLLIVFSEKNRKGTHPPELCLEGGASSIQHKGYRPLQIVGKENTDTYEMRELITKYQNQQTLYLYVFKSGDTYTPSFAKQQVRIIFNSIFSKNTSGSLIRFSIPVTDQNVQAQRQQLIAAIQYLLPQIDQKLP